MRKPRELKENASYHVIARANRKEMILNTPEIKEMMMEVLRRAKLKFAFAVKNFCIMGNHIHFILKPLKNESLSKIMQWILSVFARQYNWVFQLTGHVWQDRFVSKIIHSLLQYLTTFVYIARNPVRASIVPHAVDYEYNGVSFFHRGLLDILDRPPTAILRRVWPRICRTV